MKALVLSGGGARGAYQAGVLLAFAEISDQLKVKHPVQIFTGVSAGAINASFLAAGADDFLGTAQKLAQLWGSLHSEQVFKTDAISLGKIGLSWVGELSFGGVTGSTHSRSLLDTAPLGELIRNNVNFSRIQEHINNGILQAVGITALDYKTNETVTFVEGNANSPKWRRARRHAESARLQTEHIMASSAIPILFSPIKVQNRYFGDGCVRNGMPLSPALHLGASSLMVIGVRRWDPSASEAPVVDASDKPPSVARVVNVLLNSVLLDGIETDLERLNKINSFLQQVPKDLHETLNFKAVDYVSIHPSEDIGDIAAKLSSRLPRIVRYLLKGLGPLEDASELISYLLFEPDFCQRLVELGHQDALASKAAIENFLLRP